MNTNTRYTEITFDSMGFDRTYKNPLTKVYQHEYALYEAVSELFAAVKCKSRCVESLKMYFKELPHKPDDGNSGSDAPASDKTQEGLLEKMARMVEQDVLGHITFPMMNICAAEARTVLEDDGTHRFIFTDGIYAFSVHIKLDKKKRPERLEVSDLGRKPDKPKRTCPLVSRRGKAA